MKCPTCEIPLSITERQGIEIDYCSQCRGVWLDRGELDKIIERSYESSPRGEKDSFQRDDDHKRYRDDDHKRHTRDFDGDYSKRHKKKSLFDDLFDF